MLISHSECEEVVNSHLIHPRGSQLTRTTIYDAIKSEMPEILSWQTFKQNWWVFEAILAKIWPEFYYYQSIA